MPKSSNHDLVRLWIVVAIAILLSAYWLAMHLIDRLRVFFEFYTSLPVTPWLTESLFAGLLALLWVANRRWRDSVRREAELDRILTSITPDTLLVVTPGRTIARCNIAVQSMFGYDVEELIGQKTDLLYSDRRLNPERREVHSNLESVGFHAGYATGRKKNGTTFAITLTTSKLQGTPGAVILIRDVTEQQRAQQALRKSHEILDRRVEERTAELRKANEELLREVAERRTVEQALRTSESTHRTLTDASPDMIYLLDGEGRILYANPRAVALLGGAPEGLIGKPQSQFFEAEMGARHQKAIRQVFETGKPCMTETPEHFSRGNVWFDTRLIPIVNDDGATTAVLGISRDVTERRFIESALRESEENFRTLVDNVTKGIIIVSGSDCVLYANRKAAEITGNLSPEYLIGTNLRRVLASFEKQRARHEGDSKAADYEGTTIVRADGVRVPVEIAAAPTRWKGEPCDLVVFEDITFRKEVEARKLEDQAKLRVLASELSLAEDRERRRLATRLHDGVGQTLALCKIKLGSLPAGAADTPDERSALLETKEFIEEAMRQARSLMAELSPPVLYELGLDAALEWLAEELGHEYGVPIQLHKDSQPKLLDDSMRVVLFKAARELIINAIKHARPRRIRINSHSVGSTIHLEVDDDGVGFVVPQANDFPRGQSGFGLFFVKERMTFLGGKVLIRSQPGHGTRVTLVAPLQPATAAEEGNS